MLTVNDYIKMLLKKKRWSLNKFANEINEVKRKIGMTSHTTPQNISNFLNQVDDKHILRPKQLCIWEKALDVESGTLCNMVELPKSKNGIRELENLKRKIKDI